MTARPTAGQPKREAEDMGALDGRIAITTGAGGGIGREYALLFVSEGTKVVVNDLGGTFDGSGHDVSAAQQVVDDVDSELSWAMPGAPPELRHPLESPPVPPLRALAAPQGTRAFRCARRGGVDPPPLGCNRSLA